MSQPGCGFTGDPDLYGLGTRLGAYLLWLSTQIAYYFQLEGANGLSESWTIFSLALAIAIFIRTFQSQDADERLHPVDVVIMLYMILGGSYSCMGVIRQSPSLRPVWWRLALLNGTYAVVFGYASWFWITGAESEHFQQSSECGTVMFLFARIPKEAFRGISTFFAVLSVANTVSWFSTLFFYYENVLAFTKANIMPLSPAAKKELLEHINMHCHESLASLLVHDSELPSRYPSARLEDLTHTYLAIRSEAQKPRSIIRLDRPLTNMNDKRKVQDRIEKMAKFVTILQSDDDDEEEEEDFTFSAFSDLMMSTIKSTPERLSNLTEKTFNILRIILGAFAITCAIYAILAIELTIVWNGIGGVYTIQSTGQLIPFVIGLVGLFKVLHDVNFKFKVSSTQAMNEPGTDESFQRPRLEEGPTIVSANKDTKEENSEVQTREL